MLQTNCSIKRKVLARQQTDIYVLAAKNKLQIRQINHIWNELCIFISFFLFNIHDARIRS